jgi:hypothetical protein
MKTLPEERVMPEQITDAQVLSSYLAEEKVNGFTVKPWTIKQLLLVMPILDALVQEFTNRGVTLDNLGELFEGQGLGATKDIIQVILPRLPEFLAITLRMDREQAEELDLGLGMQLTVKVLRMNVDHLKNAFGLIMSQMGVLIGPEATP